MAAIRWYGTGARLNFPMGNAISAIHWQRGHQGVIRETFYEDDQARNSRTPDDKPPAGNDTLGKGVSNAVLQVREP
jgi:hypothetical protein